MILAHNGNEGREGKRKEIEHHTVAVLLVKPG